MTRTHLLDEKDHLDPSHEEAVKPFLTEHRRKAIKAEMDGLYDDMMEELAQYASLHISETATARAVKFLEKVLNGDEESARALFGAEDSSRYRACGHDKGKPWSSLIHGSLFETGEVKLRRKLVEVHADLLRSERIKDLESVVDGLTRQIKKLEEDQNRY